MRAGSEHYKDLQMVHKKSKQLNVELATSSDVITNSITVSHAWRDGSSRKRLSQKTLIYSVTLTRNIVRRLIKYRLWLLIQFHLMIPSNSNL